MAARFDATDTEYHQRREMSKSRLFEFYRDPQLFHLRETGRLNRPEPTDSMLWGLDLEAWYFHARLHDAVEIPSSVLSKSGSRAGGAWEAFKDEHRGERLMKTHELDARTSEVKLAAEQITQHDEAHRLLAGEHHVNIEWRYRDVEFKSQLDVLNIDAGCIVDLKTSKNPSATAFSRQMVDFWYDVQAWCYQLAYYQLTGDVLPVRFVVVKNTPSYHVEVYQASADFIQLGQRRADVALDQYLACRESGIWQTETHGEVIELDPPNWATKQLLEWESPV